ncbi:MAG: right-handed parallel beta-helix repeat-containing protein [Clostridiales bacterium]|nr:right-handed parallel beta-helix repeat-containing protein [Clostridiales bacterium]
MNIDDALSYVQDPGNEHYGKIINLTADITSGVSAININDKNDVVIGLGQYNLTCPSLTITNGSLILWGESNTTGTQGMFTVSGGISLDNGVFITQDDEGKMARVIAEGVSPTVDIITATNGSIVEINGGFISNAAGATGSGIKADGGSKVKAGGGVISAPGSIGVSASGKGTVVEITDNIIALGTGVYAVSEAKVTVDSYIWGMQGDGIYAYGGANVTVNNNTTFPVFGFFKGIYAEGAGTTVSVKGSVESLSTAPEVYPEVAVEAIDGAKVTVDASMFPNGSVLGTDFGAYAEGEGTFISIKTADGGSLGIRGYGDCVAHASGGGEIYVNGDLDTGSGTYTGARVRNGGKITVDGEIQTNTLSTYIDLGDAAGDKKTRTQFDGTTTKPGYYTFSKTDAGKTNTVWVRVQQPSHVCGKYHEGNFRQFRRGRENSAYERHKFGNQSLRFFQHRFNGTFQGWQKYLGCGWVSEYYNIDRFGSCQQQRYCNKRNRPTARYRGKYWKRSGSARRLNSEQDGRIYYLWCLCCRRLAGHCGRGRKGRLLWRVCIWRSLNDKRKQQDYCKRFRYRDRR